MRKIALIHLGVDGAGPVYSLEMAKALTAAGHQVLAVVSTHCDIIDRWRAVENISLLEIDTYTSRHDFIRKSLHLKTFLTIRRILRQYRPEIVYSPMSDLWQPLIFGLLIPRGALRIKTIHDPKPHQGEDNWLMRIYHRFSYRHADKIVVLSNTFIPQLEEKGIARHNIIVIPHPNFDYYTGEQSIATFQDHGRILFFGRIIKYKGLNILLEAMKIVVKQMPRLRLVIAGAGDITPYRSLLDELRDNLELHLYQIPDSEVSKLFTHCDYVVLPYTDASQSGVIPLSYSFAKPVIASALGGIPEQVRPDTGILIEPSNIRVLADAILELSGDPARIRQMGQNAKRYSDNELTWASAAHTLISSL